MAFSTLIRSIINSGLNRVGLQLNTLTAFRRESARLELLLKTGYFDAPAFPVLASFEAAIPSEIIDDLGRYSSRFDDFMQAEQNPVGYSFDNGFFSSPDAEVLYCMIRRYRPSRIVEVGSGNSTKISRLALIDGDLNAELCSIDPQPREKIDCFADRIYRDSVENVKGPSLFAELGRDDVLFIDSSHELRPGNDLTHLYLTVIPTLAPGVLVHIHDVFLPYDYRADWVLKQRLPYTEQYLVHAILNSDARFEVLWPGYYLQRTRPEFSDWFPHRNKRDAQSLWLRTR